jgi:hypothetical protein
MSADLFAQQQHDRIRELEAGLEAACRWLYEPVRPDVEASRFDYAREYKERKLDPSYLLDLAAIRVALRKDSV